MREIKMNGYIDEEAVFGDEITPDGMRGLLFAAGEDWNEDVHITLNSYGGSVNAATIIHDTITSYPGRVHITVSGTAASAAVGMAMAADELTMTPGSMMMIHDPIMMAWGNKGDMEKAIQTLDAAKESILNIYENRSGLSRDKLSDLMSAETWMDAQTALKYGFIDNIAAKKGAENCKAYNIDEARKRVKAFYERPRARDEPRESPRESPREAPPESGLKRRLNLMMMER